MNKSITGLIIIAFIAIVLIFGCGKKQVMPDPIVYDNMIDNPNPSDDQVNDTITVDNPVVVPDTDVLNDTTINDTIDDSFTENVTIIDGTSNNDDSVYSAYRDTSLIDDSIDDVESLN